MDQGGPKREFFRLFAQNAAQMYFKGDFMDNNITAVRVSTCMTSVWAVIEFCYCF